MALDNLKLAIALRLADKISAPAKKVAGVNGLLTKRLKGTLKAMSAVNKQAAQVKSLGGLQARIGKTAQQATEAKTRLAGLWQEFNKASAAGRSTKRLQQQIGATQKRVAKLADEHGNLKDKANAARKALRKEGVDTRKLGSAQEKLDQKLKGLNRRMERHKNLLKVSSKAGQAMSAAWGKMKTAGKWLGGGVIAGGLAAMPMVSTASQFENYQTVLTTIEGSEGKAKKSMEWVSKFAAKTPYDLAQVNEAFVRLKSYGLDPTSGLLRTLGDTSSAMGKDVMSAVEAISDAVTGENERLKEFGITTQTKGDLVTYNYTDKAGNQKAMSAIKGDRKQIEKVLTNIWDEKFEGGMERGSKTWTGLLSNIMDTWSRFQMMIMNSGPFQRIKGYLSDLLARLDTMAENGQLQAWAEKVGGAIMKFIDGVAVAVPQIWDLIQTIAPAVSTLANFTGGWGNLAAVVGGSQLLGGFDGIGKALLWIGRIAMAHPLLALITGVGLGALWVVKNWDTIGPWFSNLWAGIKDSAATVWEWMKKAFEWSPVGMIIKHFDSIKSAFAGVINWIMSKVPDWLKKRLGINGGIPINPAAQMTNVTTTPAIAAAGAGGGNIQASFTINTQPGDDKQAVALQVRQEMEKMQRENAARSRRKLHD